MRKVILFLLIFNSVLFSDWEQIESPLNMFIYSVQFVNSSTGYIGSEAGMIYKTTNGGQNWVFQQLAGLGANNINDIFINPINSNYIYAAGNDGSFHRTTNAGANWIFTDLGTANLRTVVFFDLLHGITAAYGTQLYVTSNGGSNWTPVSTGIASENYWCSFATSNAVYVSSSGGKIAKSTNAGQNWIIQNINEDAIVFSVYFKDVNTGYAGTDGGKVYQTTNGGTNWFLLSVLNPPISINKITSNGIDLYLCGSAGYIYKRPAGGNTWYPQVSNSSSPFFDLCFADENTGYAVGSSGKIRKTTNGGNTIGIEPVSGTLPEKFSLSQNYPNPFNPETNIEFSVPYQSHIKLAIYDNIGREVSLLADEFLSAGVYKVNFDAGNLTSGVYFYRFTTKEYSSVKKMILIK